MLVLTFISPPLNVSVKEVSCEIKSKDTANFYIIKGKENVFFVELFVNFSFGFYLYFTINAFSL